MYAESMFLHMNRSWKTRAQTLDKALSVVLYYSSDSQVTFDAGHFT